MLYELRCLIITIKKIFNYTDSVFQCTEVLHNFLRVYTDAGKYLLDQAHTERWRRGLVGGSGGVVSFCTHFRWLVKGFSCILHPAGYCSLCWSSSSVWFFLSSASVAVCHLAPMGHPSPGSSPIRRPQMFYLCVDNYVDGGKVLLKYAWTRGVWESADGVASRCARPHRSGRHVWFQPLIEWCFSKSAK